MALDVANATDTYAERVAARRDDLAPAERRVAELLIERGPQASLLSAAALAEELGTSDATVVRTAKALGYGGLAELRRALAAFGDNPPLGERLRRTLEQTAGAELFSAAVGHHLAAVDTLTHNVSPESFQAAVAVLAAGDRVVWRGVGPSAHLAAYAELICRRVGTPSRALVHSGTSFADELLSLGSGDTIVLFAYGRMQSDVRVLLDHATGLEIPVVLVTDTLGRRLADRVHTVLECGRGAPGLFSSHATTLVVVEALVLALAATDPAGSQRSLEHLNELRAALAGRRIDVDTP